MARAMWKGAIQFGLVTIPVKLYLATESSYQVRFNMLHDKDLSADPDEDVLPGRGRGHLARRTRSRATSTRPSEYVVITDEDLEKVPLKTVRTIEIEQFTKADARGLEDPVRQAGLLHRARQDRPQGVLPAEVGPRGRGPHRDLQGRDQGPRGARVASTRSPTRCSSRPSTGPTRSARRASSTCPTRSSTSSPPSWRWRSSSSRR